MTGLPRMLAILGSGETAPTMIKPHRALFERLPPDARAVVLDTPYGFQENAEELSAKTLSYFRQSVGREVSVAELKRVIGVEQRSVEAACDQIRRAQWVFAGPGSPSYALRQWEASPVPALLAEKLAEGGVVVFSSAASLTLGRFSVPVYELYKVGAEPYWHTGLDLLAQLDLPVAVIPHYDNTEGGHHDTRFCYQGERRLAALEEQLPDDAFVLGIDEHTGVVFDLDADTATVVGNGFLTIRRSGASVRYPSGTTVAIDVLRHAEVSGAGAVGGGAIGGGTLGGRDAVGGREVASTGASAPAAGAAVGGSADGSPGNEPTTLGGVARSLEADFDAAIARGDADAATSACLDLEQALTDWSADPTQSEDGDRARATLRSMINRLGAAARDGLRDPRELLDPIVSAALALRSAVRAEKRYDLSDLLRDHLAAGGIEIRDTPEGPQWSLVD